LIFAAKTSVFITETWKTLIGKFNIRVEHYTACHRPVIWKAAQEGAPLENITNSKHRLYTTQIITLAELSAVIQVLGLMREAPMFY